MERCWVAARTNLGQEPGAVSTSWPPSRHRRLRPMPPLARLAFPVVGAWACCLPMISCRRSVTEPSPHPRPHLGIGTAAGDDRQGSPRRVPRPTTAQELGGGGHVDRVGGNEVGLGDESRGQRCRPRSLSQRRPSSGRRRLGRGLQSQPALRADLTSISVRQRPRLAPGAGCLFAARLPAAPGQPAPLSIRTP